MKAIEDFPIFTDGGPDGGNVLSLVLNSIVNGMKCNEVLKDPEEGTLEAPGYALHAFWTQAEAQAFVLGVELARELDDDISWETLHATGTVTLVLVWSAEWTDRTRHDHR